VTTSGRVLHAGLQLLDRQLVDRTGRLCGKVDDLEISEPNDRGDVYLAAVLAGPGALLARTGHSRLGDWLRRVVGSVFPVGSDDPVRIRFNHVADIGNHVTLSLDAEEVATFAGERWVRDHVIGHIPGNRQDASE
jgi:hypothetical protein